MTTSKRIQHFAVFIAFFLFISFCSIAQKIKEPGNIKESWIKKFEPFRIAGNLYYVGTDDLACYLITTPQGHVLINTGTAASFSIIRDNVKKLGFRFSDIRILLTNQVHYDHVGAMAAIKKRTGAAVMVDEKDAAGLATGGNSDYFFGGRGCLFKPVKADQLLYDRDTINFGGMKIMVLHHPGHTEGSCSFLFDVKDSNHTYRVLIANMPTIIVETKFPRLPSYPNIAGDYAYTINAMKHLDFDIWFAAHASQFNLHEKHKPGDAYNPEAFADRQGYDKALDELEKDYLKRMEDK